ncbi:MAG: Murein hydrolase activator NlpD precursor [Candidatus Dependentiae bacterium ADurb.Bin331]|nr:MAG: Murein hydrolase activator NlpD precursor [Candidatus Dependentiae bacterium ADurb.Bin331]
MPLIVHAVLFIALGIVIALLINLYENLHTQSRELIELKNEYDTYVLMYKKIFDDYKSMKENGRVLPEMAAQEREMITPSFEVVNRNPDYLAKSAVDFGKHYNLEDSLRVLYNGIDGSRYQEPRSIGTKRNRPKTRINRSAKNYHYLLTQGQRRSDCSFQWPIKREQFWLSSRFGPRKKVRGPTRGWKFHYGIDLAAIEGTAVGAAAPGVVIEVSYSKKGYGNTIVLAHAGSRTSRYAHLKTIKVRYGEKIQTGQLIGCVGATGQVIGSNGKKSASHLHFEVKEHGKHIDPLLVLT